MHSICDIRTFQFFRTFRKNFPVGRGPIVKIFLSILGWGPGAGLCLGCTIYELLNEQPILLGPPLAPE